MKPLFLTDCDDTLFMTARKIRDAQIEDCEVASTLTDGSPSGYRTPRLLALRSLMESGDVVPVTARSRDVLARCEVPQAPAICSNGGVVVRADGSIDEEWHARIAENVGDGTCIREVHERAAQLAGDGFRHWTVDERDVPLYIVLKSNASDEGAVARLALDIEDEAAAWIRACRDVEDLLLRETGCVAGDLEGQSPCLDCLLHAFPHSIQVGPPLCRKAPAGMVQLSMMMGAS